MYPINMKRLKLSTKYIYIYIYKRCNDNKNNGKSMNTDDISS